MNGLKYAFPDKITALELIDKLNLKGRQFNEIVKGINIWGFEDEYEASISEYEASISEYEEPVLIKKGLTFNVDVCWQKESLLIWKDYEINPKTPSHKFT